MRVYFTLILLGLTSLAHADVIGLRISGGIWSYEATGDIRDSASVTDNFNLKDDFGMKDDEVFSGFIYIEHPVPVIPNIRIGTTSLDLSGNGSITGGKTWNGVTFPDPSDVISSVDLSHNEIGLYYEIVDTVFDFDLGINVKLFDGTVSISDGLGNDASSSFSETIPMLYGSVGVPLPAGFSIGGDISYISYNGDSFSDYFVNVRWDSSFLLGVEVGYRSFIIDYTDGNKIVDVAIKGPYINARLVF